MKQQKRTTRIVSAVLVVCVLAGAALVYLSRRGPGSGDRLVFSPPVASLDEAVDKGLVSRTTVSTLRKNGAVDVIASFEVPSFSTPGASPVANQMTDQDISDLIDRLNQAYAQLKAGAYGGVPGVTVLDELPSLPNAMLRITDERALLALVSAPGVIGVSQPRSYSTLDDENGVPMINADDTAAAGNRGDGTVVAVLDTGVDYTKPTFGPCTGANAPEGTCVVTFAKKYGAQQDDQLDDDGHGTNVAGIVHAVAPAADILALDVFHPAVDETGQPTVTAEDEDILAALNDVVSWKQQGVNIVAANMSLGSGGFFTEACTQLTNDQGVTEPNTYVPTFANLRIVGIIPVVAAGNDGGGGLLGSKQEGIAAPACTPGAVSVGAVYAGEYAFEDWASGCSDFATSPDEVTCFSQTGPNLSLYAPGSEITAAGITESGTSQAAPHVAGAVAVLKGALPNTTIDQVEGALESTGPVVEDPGLTTTYGKHRLDVAAALAALGGGNTSIGDTTAPTVGTVGVSVQDADTRDGYTTLELTWEGRDDVAVTQYYLWVSSDGSAYTQISLPSPTSTDVLENVRPGHTFTFAVQAADAANNGSDFSYSQPVAL